MNPMFILLIYWIYKVCKYVAEGNEWKSRSVQSVRLITARNEKTKHREEWSNKMHLRYGYKYDPWYPIFIEKGELTLEEFVKWNKWIWDNLKS